MGNTIHSNGDLGIDLGSDSVTTNDAGDTDTGSNGKLNFPEFVTVVQNGASLDINFNLDVPAGNYRIEFFDNPGGIDASLHGEGQTFVGATTITHTGSGGENFNASFTFSASDAGNITSTTTEDLGGGIFGATSEFNSAITAIDAITGRVFEDINYGGGAGRDYITADTSAQASGWTADAIGSGAGVVVELYEDQSGNFIKIADTSTDANGNYSFPGLADNTYRVRVVNDTVCVQSWLQCHQQYSR